MKPWLQASLIGRLVKKDVFSIARDRRTLMTTLLLPLVFAPLFMLLMPAVMSFIFGKSDQLKQTLAVEANVPESLRAQFSIPLFRIAMTQVDDVETQVREGKFKIGVRLRSPLPSNMDAPPAQLEVFSNQLDTRGRSMLLMLETAVSRYNETLLQDKLRALSIDSGKKPLALRHTPIDPKRALGFISLLLPFLIIIWGMIGIQATALEAVFGERDRHTLEPLLVTPIDRSSVLIAKLLAIAFFGALSAIAGVLGFLLTIWLAKFGAAQFLGQAGIAIVEKIMLQFVGPYFGANMGFGDALLLLQNLVSLLIGLASLILLPCIFARTQQEAQMYCGLGVLVGMAFMVPAGVNEAFPLGAVLYALPISGSAASAAECLRGEGAWLASLGATCASLVFAMVVVLLSLWSFRKERVIFRS